MTKPDQPPCATRRWPYAVLRALRLGLLASVIVGSVLFLAAAPGHQRGALLLGCGVIATQVLMLAEERCAPWQGGLHALELQRRLHQARAEILRCHAEHVEELNALSCEIAHELKNPLTCVKGVAELMALERDPGRAAERLCVLHGQVVRTLKILEEFLQLSRPLVPLSQETIDLRELCAGVAELFEGQARERGASIMVDAAGSEEPIRLRCDPRKLRQVLIHLVQSALLVSLPQGQLCVDLKRWGDHVGFKVRVQGPQDAGSCVDLNLARCLVEQQGGSLVIDREDGGYRAAVILPIDGVDGGTGRGQV